MNLDKMNAARLVLGLDGWAPKKHPGLAFDPGLARKSKSVGFRSEGTEIRARLAGRVQYETACRRGWSTANFSPAEQGIRTRDQGQIRRHRGPFFQVVGQPSMTIVVCRRASIGFAQPSDDSKKTWPPLRVRGRSYGGQPTAAGGAALVS